MTEPAVHITRADATDIDRIESMLQEAGLPIAGVRPIIEDFLVIREGGEVVAAGVIEWHDGDGLIRSVVVDPEHQGQGLGRALVGALMASTPADLYLLTETATGYFRGLGFESIERNAAPAALRQSEEFRCLCGESAAFMRRSVVAS